jgi:hypothetical protein
MTTPKSADTTEADLEEILKGLKQEQLDKLTKELSKKGTPDLSVKWNEAKEKIKRRNRIQSLSDNIYLENRKAPYHFESIKEYNAYDKMCRNRATEEAIRRIVAEDMERKDE